MHLLDLAPELLIAIQERLEELTGVDAFARSSRVLYEIVNRQLYRRNARKDGYALRWAANEGRMDTARRYLAETAGIHRKRQFYYLPIVSAASRGHADMVELLVTETGANVNCHSKDCTTPLIAAVQNGDTAVIRVLIDRHADPNFGSDPTNPGLRRPMWHAVCHQRVNSVKALVEKGAEWDYVEGTQMTPLEMATSMGFTQIFKYLVALAGLDKRVNDPRGIRLLHLAAGQGHKTAVKHLLSCGYSADALDETGLTPLRRALINGRSDIAKLLLDKGADVHTRGTDLRTHGPSMLREAVGNTNVPLLNLLLKKGVKASDLNGEGYPWFCVRVVRRRDVIGPLVQNGLDVNIRLREETKTLMEMAVEHADEGTVELLIDAGAELEGKGHKGRTPIFIAVYRGHEPLIKLLADRGADLGFRDKRGDTPLEFAKRKRRKESVIKLLEELTSRWEQNRNDE
jgi:ankyrin repeat protein